MIPIEIWRTIRPVLLKRYKRTETFLNFTNTWELLIAVILSAQMTDDGVNKITPALFARFSHPALMQDASLSEVTRYIKKVNYFNAKARYLKQTAQILMQDFQGRVPDNSDDLMKLSGVGRKTAVAVLANGFGKYVGIAVDTHVIRFVKRFHLSRHTDASKIEQDLLKIIKPQEWNVVSYAIKEYGRKEGRARGYVKDRDPLAIQLEKSLAKKPSSVYTNSHMAKRLSQDIKNKASHSKKTKKRVELRYAAKKALAATKRSKIK